jgi:hypothetical protein
MQPYHARRNTPPTCLHPRAPSRRLAIFCDPDGVVARSNGAVGMCLDERARPPPPPPAPAGEPLRAYCFSFDSSGWSNNVAMFRREWWLAALGHGAVLTGPGDNGMFELNMVQLCDYTAKKGLGTGAANAGAASVCQLAPGLFFHEEDDGWGKGR